ncbi:peptidase inhibitor family I36 protein [Streptomyces sp. 8N114]|uniref:peptidase inhibitor family I36 protein n=1 Tax=Streptomyces sp. 8N114 TaxID=3457419 RepID=UPI003FD1C203
MGIGALSLGAASLIGLPSTAQATTQAVTGDNCTSRYLCLYEHDDFEGRGLAYVHDGLGCWNLSTDDFSNKASSMVNNTSYSVKMYDRANCAGASGYTAQSESEDKDLTNNGFDNKASSIKL